ncbi:MAG: hypothetical protein ABH886_02105 [Candidatus Desantisbacteria bacterium]
MTMTIAIDDKVYNQFNEIAKQQNQSLEKEIFTAIQEYIENRKKYLNDPFFKIGASGSSDIIDGSINHDQYLYGVQL